MTRVYIAQCLCGPNRHAIIALAGEFDDEAQAFTMLIPQLRTAVGELFDAGVNRWCGICGAVEPGWRYEVGRTRFRSMEEGRAEMEKTAAGNLLANALFGTHGSEPPKKQ